MDLAEGEMMMEGVPMDGDFEGMEMEDAMMYDVYGQEAGDSGMAE